MMRKRKGKRMKRTTAVLLAVLFIFSGFANVEDLNRTAVASPTVISGSICAIGAGTMTWDISGSPYWVECNVTVADGARLVIEAGVSVKFNGTYSLFIDGNLTSIGNQDRIEITSNKTIPSPGDWSGIRINATGHVDIEYADIGYGFPDIYIFQSSNNIIMNTNVSYSGYNGIYLDSSSSNMIANNSVSENGQQGIYLYRSSNNTLTDNHVAGNGDSGIFLESSTNNMILDNNVKDNSNNGIQLLSSSDNNTFIGNTVTNNSDSGFRINGSSNNTINDNIALNNSFYGVYSASSENNTITGNDVAHNGGIGIGVFFSSLNFTIEDNNISFNGLNGISLASDSSGITVIGNNVTGNWVHGIYLYSSSENNVANNNVSNNGVGGSYYGIYIHKSSDNNTIAGNQIINNSEGGIIVLESSNNNTLENNEVNDNHEFGVFLYLSSNNSAVENDIWNQSEGFHVFSESNSTFANNQVDNNLYNMVFIHSSGNFISNNTITSAKDTGIYAQSLSNNSIVNNTILSSQGYGCIFLSSSNNTIGDNIVSSGLSWGIYVHNSENNTLVGNNVTLNMADGIDLDSSHNNTLIMNNIESNDLIGIHLISSYNNSIYHNNLVDNFVQANDDGNDNRWNDSYPSGGNYWSDYSLTCLDNRNGADTPQASGSSDGICDAQHNIDSDSIDFYPLTNRLLHPPVLEDSPPTISDLRPLDTSTIFDNQPVIGANYSDTSGIDTSGVMMKVDDIDVTSSAQITASGITYTPAPALSNTTHKVFLEVRDGSPNHNYANKTWNFTVDNDLASPAIAGLMPSDSSTINDRKPLICANFTDASGIDLASVILEVDGLNVTSSSSIEQDGIRYLPGTELSEGVHTVLLVVGDGSHYRNIATATWSFTVQANVEPDTTPPGIVDRRPVDSSATSSDRPTIGANYSDLVSGINASSILLKVDGIDVTSLASVTMSGIAFAPSAALAGGLHNVYLEVGDNAGNLAISNWTFSVTTSGPSEPQNNPSTADWWILFVIIVFVTMAIVALLVVLGKKRRTVRENKEPEKVDLEKTVK